MEFQKHDLALLEILKDERNIANFLDTFFGFMCRCTDFYVESRPGEKLGFPPGIAEDLILKIYRKWKSKFDAERLPRVVETEPVAELPELVQEVEVSTVSDDRSEENAARIEKSSVQPSDSYNGAVREDFTWSQTIGDLDVLVNIPKHVRKAKDLRVDITSDRIQIAAKTESVEGNENRVASVEWSSIFDGELSFKTQKEESIWCLAPGKHVGIHLEKAVERWWEALIKGEPKIELSKIDCSRPIDDLGDNEQMKVQELMWNHQQKLLGKPTSEQINLEKVLKKAWNVEGSPFKGSKYDPSVLNFN